MAPSSNRTLAVVSASAIVGGGLLWYYTFRRTAPKWTTKDLPPTVDDFIKVVTQLSAEERFAIKTAFLAGDDFKWMIAGKDHKTNLDVEMHERVTFYVVECLLSFAERYGYMLVCKDDSGKFQGALGLIPPYKNKTLLNLHLYKSLLSCGIPVPMMQGKDVRARFNALCSETTVHHGEIMKDTPHWYVLVVGVADDMQGKGVGKKLIQAAAAIADGMPLYLECADHNVKIYERLGYVQVKRYFLQPKGIEDMTSFPLNGMVAGGKME